MFLSKILKDKVYESIIYKKFDSEKNFCESVLNVFEKS